jgi:iron complex outermembrane recepter protein
MHFNPRPLDFAVKLMAASIAMNPAVAQTGSSDADPIPVILVTALGIDEDTSRIAAPFSILNNKQLFERSGTLGDILNGIPGVHADTFGGGASRPVVRGQTSPRVKVLSDSTTLLDASDISPDHAVTADPLLAQRVEVLRGPATLLYGGGAIGGVINVLDNKIPATLPEGGAEGMVALRGNSAAREQAGALSFTGRVAGNLAVHVEASLRDVEEYEAEGFSEDRVDGTFAEGGNGSVGASWIGDNGYLGLAYSYRDDDYGIPGHSHEYEGCHPHGATLHCGEHSEGEGDHEHENELGHEVPVVDLNSERVDLRGEYREPFAGIHRIRLRASHTDYEHHELDEGVISTTFRNGGFEARVELDHAPLFGWHGVVGTQFSDTESSALGVEAFIPKTESRSAGVFAVEHFELTDDWHIEAGVRHERQEHEPVADPRNRPAFDGSATSFSGAIIWAFDDDHTLGLTLADSQRLPHAQELYARGIHLATNTYECGAIAHSLTCGGPENNAPVGKEEAQNVELSLRRHSGSLTYGLNVFSNDVDGYFYARTLDQFEGFRLIKYTQRNAEFRGVEAQLDYAFTNGWTAGVFGDYVRAEFASGGNLPRISPSRLGARMSGELGGVSAQLEYYHAATQDDIASYETETPGYNMLNLSVSFAPFGVEQAEVFVRASNLLNDEVWNHTSFLAAVVPLPGRNLSAGFRYLF